MDETYQPNNTLEDVLSVNSQASKNAVKAGALTAGLGFLIREGYRSATTMAQVGTILKSALPSALTFGGLTYGLSLIQNSKSPTGKLEGLAITSAAAVPSYFAVVKTAPLVLHKLYLGLGAALKGSYAIAMPYLATAVAGLFLGFSLLKGIIGSVKRLAKDYIGKYFDRDDEDKEESFKTT
jgi:hypothetical protein